MGEACFVAWDAIGTAQAAVQATGAGQDPTSQAPLAPRRALISVSVIGSKDTAPSVRF